MSEDIPDRPADVLGVPSNADPGEIKAAYRELAKEVHPDVNDDPDAAERFAELRQARAALLETRDEDQDGGQSSGGLTRSGVDAQSADESEGPADEPARTGPPWNGTTGQDEHRKFRQRGGAGSRYSRSSSYGTRTDRHPSRSDESERRGVDAHTHSWPRSNASPGHTDSTSSAEEEAAPTETDFEGANRSQDNRHRFVGRRGGTARRLLNTIRPLDVLIGLIVILGSLVFSMQILGWQLPTVTDVRRGLTDPGNLSGLLAAPSTILVALVIGVFLIAGVVFATVLLLRLVVPSRSAKEDEKRTEGRAARAGSGFDSPRDSTRLRSELKSIGWIAGLNLAGLAPFVVARLRGELWGGFSYVIYTAGVVTPGVILFALLGAGIASVSPSRPDNSTEPTATSFRRTESTRSRRESSISSDTSIRSMVHRFRPRNGSVPGALTGMAIALTVQLVTWQGLIISEVLFGIAPPVSPGPWLSPESARIGAIGLSPLGNLLIGSLMAGAIFVSIGALFWSFPMVVRGDESGDMTSTGSISAIWWDLFWLVPLTVISVILVGGIDTVSLPAGIVLSDHDLSTLVLGLPALTVIVYLSRERLKRLFSG